MKKIVKLILPVFLLALILVPKVNAKEITDMNVSVDAGEITLNGTTEDGVLAVAAMVYDESGKTFITMQTSSVDENNKYSLKIEVEKGTYLVKVADYNGGDYKTQKVTVATDKDNPKTGDKIVAYIVTLVLSLAAIVLTTIYIKKTKFDKK